MSANKVYLSPPHMNGEEMKYIQQAFETNWIAPLGYNVDCLEDSVKKYVGMPEALAVSSGTAAMHLALKYLNVGRGDFVFCSDITFAASCNPIVYQQAQPVFIDSDEESWCLSPELLSKALEEHRRNNKLPKAVIVVDLYGLPARYEAILDICSQYGVPVIEDAAEALGSSYQGRLCGSFGDINVLSFNANKIITTSGGGMVLAKEKNAIEKMKFWATQSREKARHYEHAEIGYNYRLSNICAGIGRGQMESIETFVEARRRIFDRYVKELSHLPVSFYPQIDGALPNCWLSVMRLNQDCGIEVNWIIDTLGEANIESRPFWKPMHMQPVFEQCAFYSNGTVPIGEQLFASSICLPSGSALSEEEQMKIIELIKSCF